MRYGRIILMMVLASALAMGCATTGARQDTETTPVLPPLPQEDSEEDFIQTDDSEEEQTPEGPIDNVSVPDVDGWDHAVEGAEVVYTHRRTRSQMIFSFALAETGTPEEIIEEVWIREVESSLGNDRMDINMPMTMEIEGRDMSMFTRIEERDDGVRITSVFLCFESEHPVLHIVMFGYWPELLDAQMLQALETISRGIRVRVAGPDGPPPEPELDRGGNEEPDGT
ncbi:MAG: hypothetical protein U9Q03_03715 [Patescibacteria group bacterium]|nr:hypothetical protein [Patescibacteria group bacterium]